MTNNFNNPWMLFQKNQNLVKDTFLFLRKTNIPEPQKQLFQLIKKVAHASSVSFNDLLVS